MASVTQTTDNYYAGISQQPDLKKFPGQVKDIINGIPDTVEGLYKRPGSKRIGADKLATNEAVNNGTWFHYYRDETEGSYVGQVSNEGILRVWSCEDGSAQTIWYEQDNQSWDPSDGDHVSIKNYLTASTVGGVVQNEDIQPLTINDTTFFTNRSKTVATTGTTTARSENHFAFVEILRTENGRQYSMNIFENEVVNGIDTATRLKIQSDTLAEGSDTGTCPGIGTQVFSITNGGRKNLIFRITTVGQTGQINGYDHEVPSSAFSCSYSRDVTLLHGGEGWNTGDTATVTLDQAKTSYNYTVRVEDHETINGKFNIKGVRPAPTPFDSETAVSMNTIIGGITAELPTTGAHAISYKVIGNGIYLWSANAFSVEILEKDLMRVFQEEVNDVSELPTQCKDGYIVKVANSSSSTDDDYWLTFKGNDGRDGPGTWVECPQGGIVKSLDATTMPHVLQRQADGDFLVKKYTWADRTVGDDDTNPLPSFVGKKINKVLFHRNRLALLSGESIVLSRPQELDVPSFFAKTALAVSAVDPIDITSSSTFPSDLFDGIETTTGLVAFSTNQQFLLSSDAEIMNPDTAKLRSVSAYNYNKDLPPISLGLSVGYIDNSGKYSRFNEMADIKREGEPLVVETSKVVPTLLPKDLDLIANSRENQIVLFGKNDSDIVYGYKYLQTGPERVQQAWFKWKLNNPIKYHFIVDDNYYFVDMDGFLQRISLMQESTDPSIDENNVNFLINLDNWTTITNGSYNATTKVTTFSGQSNWIDNVTTPNGALVLVDIDSGAARVGRYATCSLGAGGVDDNFTVPGDWSTGTFYIGYLYDYQVDFPTFYLTQSQGKQAKSDVTSSLVIHRLKFNFGKSGLYTTTLERAGKDPYTETYEAPALDEYLASDAPYLEDQELTVPVYEKNTNVKVSLKSTHPAPATLHALSWEGDYSPKNYRRV